MVFLHCERACAPEKEHERGMRGGHGGEEEKTGCESEAAGPGLSPGVFCEEATERRRQRKSEKERKEEGSAHGQKNEEGVIQS